MYGIFTYIWVIYGVNVGKYSIHGAYGIDPGSRAWKISTINGSMVLVYIPGSSRCSLFPPLITEAKIIASNSGKRLWFEKMPLPLLGLPFESKRHYTSELGSKPEVVISLSRIGESPYFVCRIRQDDSPVYLYHDQNLNHNMNNLKQHLLHVVNII